MTVSDTKTPRKTDSAPPEARQRARRLAEDVGRLVDWRIGGPRGLQARYLQNES